MFLVLNRGETLKLAQIGSHFLRPHIFQGEKKKNPTSWIPTPNQVTYAKSALSAYHELKLYHHGMSYTCSPLVLYPNSTFLVGLYSSQT